MNIGNERIIVDACCGICLYASGYMRSILQTLPQIAIAEYVFQNEMKSIHNPLEAMDVTEFVNEGLVEILALQSEAEEQTSVNLAFYMEDGEADSGAIAIHRQWVLATDERKVIAHFQSNYPHIQLATTPEILKYWADENQLSAPDIAMAIRNIELRARYVVASDHALREWWQYFKTLSEVG